MNVSYILNLLADDVGQATPADWTTQHVLSIVLIVCMGIAAVAAIILVMLQPGNSQGIDALGGSSETFYGKNKGKSTEAKLKLATIICLVILAVFAIAFFIVQIPSLWGLTS